MESDLLTKPLPTCKRVEERMSFEQFCDLIDKDQKAYLIDGVMVMESPASYDHEDLF